MYTPDSFREADRSVAFDLVDSYGFATLFSGSAGEPAISHVPMILDRAASGRARLLGHVARANQHWKRFDGTEPAVAIFHGPHGYVSPSWYANHPSVPSALGVDETWEILRRLAEKYEVRRSQPWKVELPPDFVQANLTAIVGFQMPVDRLEAKFKLSQNKDEADRSLRTRRLR